MRAVIYTRTSTNKQSTGSQLEPLKTLVSNHGYELVEIIEDVGVSGTILGKSRNGMSKVMEMVNRREVDVVCVYSVDRIGTDHINLSTIDHLHHFTQYFTASHLFLITPM